MDTFLSIDIGTSSLKAGIISNEGKLLDYKRAYFNSALRSSPQELLHKLKFVVNSFNSPSIDGIVISGHGPSLVAATKIPENSFRVLNWDDQKILKANSPNKINNHIHSDFFLNKALFFKNQFPENYKNIEYFLPPPEFFNYYLCGKANVILPNNEYKTFYWDQSSIKALGLHAKHFPPFIQPGTIIGRLIKKTAKELNLKTGIPVITAGPDFLMSLIGSGTIKEGILCNRMGSSEGLNLFSDKK